MEKQNFEELYKKLEEEKSETTLKDLEIHQKRRKGAVRIDWVRH